MKRTYLIAALMVAAGLTGLQATRQGATEVISGELRQWHKVTLTIDGPKADETSNDPNPFVDYRMTVTFAHESGSPRYDVPGYFAADGNAADSSATSGNKWRAHFSPDKTGRWDWRVAFVSGVGVAITPTLAGQPVAPVNGRTGTLQIQASDKQAPDFRARGRLQYVGQHHLRFAGTGEYFLKAGPDSPETLLAYADFDDTSTGKTAIHTYEPHVKDWTPGDPSWKDGKGRGLIGALNYLSSKRMNVISFLPYNAGGDGDNVWPFVSRDDKFHYDASKLDQWQIVFDHAQAKGLYLHFKLQETEIDDDIRGNPVPNVTRPYGPAQAGRGGGGGRAGGAAPAGPVPTSLDGGDLGPERRLYLRELIARFGYALALNWNLGEENTQTPAQQRAMVQYIRSLDPYGHLVVLHTYPNAQEEVYQPLLGQAAVLSGLSLQNAYNATHERTVRWRTASAASGVPWVVSNDEQGPANLGVPPDLGYAGFNGRDSQGNEIYSLHDIRKYTLWGNLMGGGAGVEYYFGYNLPDNDLVAENFRSRDRSWDYAAIALDFFRTHKVPFWEMRNADSLVDNHAHDNSRYALAKPGEIYLVYLPHGGTAELDLRGVTGTLGVNWFDPRQGGTLKRGSVASVSGGGVVALGQAPDNPIEDWLVVVRR